MDTDFLGSSEEPIQNDSIDNIISNKGKAIYT